MAEMLSYAIIAVGIFLAFGLALYIIFSLMQGPVETERFMAHADVSMSRTYLEYSNFLWPEKGNSIKNDEKFCDKLKACTQYYLLYHEPCVIGVYDEFGDPGAKKTNPKYRQNEGKFTEIQNNLENKIKYCSFEMKFSVGPNVEQVIGQSNIVGPFLNPLADIYGLYFYDMKLRNASVYNDDLLSGEEKPYYLYEYDLSKSSVLCTPKGYTLRIDDTRYFSPGKYKVDLLNVSVDTSGGLPKYNVAVGFGFLPYLSNTTTNSTPLKIIDTIRSLDFNPLMPQWNIECLTDKPFVENAVCVDSRDKVPSGAEYCGDCSYTVSYEDYTKTYHWFYYCYPNECNNAVKSCTPYDGSKCNNDEFQMVYHCTRSPIRFKKYVIPINESGGVDVAQVINAIKWGFYSSKRFEFANTYWDVKRVDFAGDPWNDDLTDAIDPKNADPNDRTHIIRKIYFDCGADYICQKQITMYIGYLRLGDNGLCYNNLQSCKYIVFAVGFKGD